MRTFRGDSGVGPELMNSILLVRGDVSPHARLAKGMAASRAGGQMSQLSGAAYIFTFEPCEATHCHLPLGIFTQVSV